MCYLFDIDDLDMMCSDFVNALKILMCSEKHPAFIIWTATEGSSSTYIRRLSKINANILGI